MLFHVYQEDVPEGYYANEPFGIYRALLDADWVLWILLPLLFVIVVIGLVVGWRLHEIPKHRAEHRKLRQAELVSALTLLGLFQHWVWAVALFIAYLDWDALEDSLVRILSRSRIARGAADGVTQGITAPSSPARDVVVAQTGEPVAADKLRTEPTVDPIIDLEAHR